MEGSALRESGDKEKAIAEFRRAFCHLHVEGASISAWLTPNQKSALHNLRLSFNYKPKSHWDPDELFEVTAEERQMMVELKDRLAADSHLSSEREIEYCSDITLVNYLRARDHHLDRAYNMLTHTLSWRREKQPWEFENIASRSDKMVSDARIVGFDVQGRVVIYSSFAKTTKRVPAEVTVNTAAMMEKASLCRNSHCPGNVVWVNHFGARHKNGFNFWDANPQFALAGADVFGHHYPECLKVMIIVDPPSIFMGLWKVVKPMLPEKTRNKGEFIDSRNDNKEYFVSLFGEELAEHLLLLIEQDAQ